MNKLITATIFTLLFGVLQAQNKGKVLFGGASNVNLTGTNSRTQKENLNLMNISYSRISSKSDDIDPNNSEPLKVTSLNLSPKIGFFVADYAVLGIDVNTAFTTQKYSDNHFTSTKLISAGPFARFYFPSEKIYPFIELGGSYGFIFNEYTTNDPYTGKLEGSSQFSITILAANAGIAIPLGKKTFFDLSAGYSSTTFKNREKNYNNFRTVVSSLGLKLGVVLFLGKEKAE